MLIVIHAYFTTWQKIILHQMPPTTLRTQSGYRSVTGIHTSFWRLIYAFKSSVTESELSISEMGTELCVLWKFSL